MTLRFEYIVDGERGAEEITSDDMQELMDFQTTLMQEGCRIVSIKRVSNMEVEQ